MPDHHIAATRRWIDRLVVAENLCPFARRELDAGRVRYVICEGRGEGGVLEALRGELARLNEDPQIETTLIILSAALRDFFAFNQFLDTCEAALADMNFEGVFQIASFHPDYQFAGTALADAENYSNRSPYPMLHILREDSVAAAIDSHPDINSVPETNIARLRALGTPHLRALRAACFADDE